MRILAFGVVAKPRSDVMVNENARIFLHPPGMQGDGDEEVTSLSDKMSMSSYLNNSIHLNGS